MRIREENINTPDFWDMVWGEEPEGLGLTTDRWQMLTAGLEPPAKILDVGGGRGEFLEWLGDAYNRTLLDQSEYAVDLAIQKKRAELGMVGDCLELPFPDDTFDATFCNEVLEHVEKPRDLIAELRRVTRPRGLVGITTPQANMVDDKQHVWSFTSWDIRDFFWTEPRIEIGSGPTIVATAHA